MNESIYLLCVLRLTHSPHPLELPMVIQIRCNWSFTCCRFPPNNREPFWIVCQIFNYHYRPQTKFAKVMFFTGVCLSTGGSASRWEGGCIGGGGFASGGSASKGSLHPERGLHPGDLHPGGVCIQGGLPVHPPIRYYMIQSSTLSYPTLCDWNTFLFLNMNNRNSTIHSIS